MQNVVIERPYRFVPPVRGSLWPAIFQRLRLFDIYLRRMHGVVEHECRGVDRLRASLRAGHGILLTPNHCRPADPVVIGFLARQADCALYAMASWHLFHQGRLTRWAMRRMGAFSIYREGIDREAINAAAQILEAAERPLIIFPEGGITRTNDQLHALLDGVAFIARTAAKKRARPPVSGQVVIHPVALKYRFQGDLAATLAPVLAEMEHRLSWHPQRELPLLPRISKLGLALLALKEIEYFGQPQSGRLGERLARLIDRLLQPLEQHWLGEPQAGGVIPRVKALRMKILPEMVRNQLPPAERQQRWRQLADIYLAQQIASYPPDYLTSHPSVDRLLETVERYEEDLTDQVRVHGQLRVIVQVGEAIEVDPQRPQRGQPDPLMTEIEARLQRMLDSLAQESPRWS